MDANNCYQTDDMSLTDVFVFQNKIARHIGTETEVITVEKFTYQVIVMELTLGEVAQCIGFEMEG